VLDKIEETSKSKKDSHLKDVVLVEDLSEDEKSVSKGDNSF